MKTFKLLASTFLALALLAACSKQQDQQTAQDTTVMRDTAAHAPLKEGQGKGIVRAIDTSARTITLDHDNIPNVMDAMTMEYHVDKSGSLHGLSVGDSVSFTLQDRGDGDYVAMNITPIKK
jgi:Cu/Ag efflux protein CusF